jgi:hypothetical protein
MVGRINWILADQLVEYMSPVQSGVELARKHTYFKASAQSEAPIRVLAAPE